jgi:Clp amino terminal domain, pathogenicity island component
LVVLGGGAFLVGERDLHQQPLQPVLRFEQLRPRGLSAAAHWWSAASWLCLRFAVHRGCCNPRRVLEPFTDRARQVVVLAHEEAAAINWTHIGSEHLLLGMLREEEGLAAQILRRLGLDTEGARSEMFRQLHLDPERVAADERRAGQLPFTPRATELLTLAEVDAKRLGHNFIGTEHLLLGMTVIGDGYGVGSSTRSA